MHMLVAEDEATVRLIITRSLAEYGICDVAVDGAEAVEMVEQAFDRREPYQLICLDIMMPRIDGNEALHLIRKIEKDSGVPPGKGAKIIMITAKSDLCSVKRSFEEECDGYLVKPIQKDDLVRNLNSLGLTN